MKPDISIFLPGIRPFLWGRLYDSIKESIGKYTFELVICGPYSPPDELLPKVKYIRDFGSVARCAQIAALLSEGNLITLGADDAVYLPNQLGNAIKQHCDSYMPLRDVVTSLRYMEGGNYLPPEYFTMYRWSHFRLPGIPPDAPMMLNSIMTRKLFIEIGGYDCTVFNTCNWGGQDLTLRLLNNKVSIAPYPHHVMSCDHTNQPFDGGMYKDHKPIDKVDDMGSRGHDYDRFVELYRNHSNRCKIDFNNWKLADKVWKERDFDELKR